MARTQGDSSEDGSGAGSSRGPDYPGSPSTQSLSWFLFALFFTAVVSFSFVFVFVFVSVFIFCALCIFLCVAMDNGFGGFFCCFCVHAFFLSPIIIDF